MIDLRNVICFQQRLTHYRESFFQRSRDWLAERSIRFDLVHGKPDAAALKKNDQGHLPWAHEVQEVTFKLGKRAAVWVPLSSRVPSPELVILTQENKLLANYAWLIRRRFNGPKVAFWGHGRNFQSDAPFGFLEKWKQLLVGQVDWWFAYTQLTRDILMKDGFPDSRIAVLNNAIDNDAFQSDLFTVTDEDLLPLKKSVGNGPLGLFCGSLYPDKRTDVIVEAADRIRESIPNFSLVVIGDGPSADELCHAAVSRPWLHVVGVKKGREKAAWFKLASVVINPGLVGLHIVDSFCAGVPMVTTADALHSPEIAYLESGKNGLIVSGGISSYADAVVQLLQDEPRLSAMRQAALASAERYTLDNMVQNFCDGIVRCLDMPKK